MNLRGAVLAAVVIAAVLLPVAASAGGTGTGEGAGTPGTDATAPPGDLAGGPGPGSGSRTAGHAPAGPVPNRTPAAPPAPASGDPAPGGSASAGVPERVARCGPELASPEGIEAQTCVLAEGADTWGRTYYRNATGRELDAYLTLMAPGGRTVQVRCRVAAQDEPGRCETPQERGGDGLTAYTAVAEFAGAEEKGAGAEGSGPLLLRAGGNTAEGEGS
ncbi:hypothetical protein [Streptomyces sp. NPDC126503]|uniref:hypothetical protein n=1 Tax=Streptomyces sp. NPDC126503 TaxID=3155315 RepID=UPI003332C39E